MTLSSFVKTVERNFTQGTKKFDVELNGDYHYNQGFFVPYYAQTPSHLRRIDSFFFSQRRDKEYCTFKRQVETLLTSPVLGGLVTLLGIAILCVSLIRFVVGLSFVDEKLVQDGFNNLIISLGTIIATPFKAAFATLEALIKLVTRTIATIVEYLCFSMESQNLAADESRSVKFHHRK